MRALVVLLAVLVAVHLALAWGVREEVRSMSRIIPKATVHVSWYCSREDHGHKNEAGEEQPVSVDVPNLYSSMEVWVSEMNDIVHFQQQIHPPKRIPR